MKVNLYYSLLFLVFFLLIGSFLFFFVLSSKPSLIRYQNPYYYFLHQVFFGLIPGIILAFFAFVFPLQKIKKFTFLLVILNIIALFLVFIPSFGITSGKATRWLNFDFFSIQPSEFLKVTSILYVASWCSMKFSQRIEGKKDLLKKSYYYDIIYKFLPFIIFLGLISLGLFLQHNASVLMIILLTLFVIYFCAGTPLWHSLLIIFLSILLLFFMVRFENYRYERLQILLNPNLDPLGKGYQRTQALISLGSGGILGRGLGMSLQLLPQTLSDSIFAVIGEEFGIVGSSLLIFSFLFFFWIGYQIARKTNDLFFRLIAIGIVFWITFQAFMNIASTSGLLPIMGIPLPLFSYGGSHLIAELIAIGILLNIAKKII